MIPRKTQQAHRTRPNEPAPEGDNGLSHGTESLALDWRQSMRMAIRQPDGLAAVGDPQAHGLFATRVPPAFAALINYERADDPLLRQVLPVAEESIVQPGFVADPVGDLDAIAAPGVLHKYQGRVLLIATGSCAINCRYCFRRHFPYQMATAASGGWRGALDYIASDPTISEVILSGGDPLMLATDKLRQLSDGLRSIDHVKRLRIHSRVPSALPERINDELLQWLDQLTLQTVLVTHINHAQELGDRACSALSHLKSHGVTLLNQSVLLRDVNDRVDTLAALSEGLFANGVLPYYLHLLDPVAGAAHFEVEQSQALRLLEALQARLPGYLVPKLVQELAGADSKRSVAVEKG